MRTYFPRNIILVGLLIVVAFIGTNQFSEPIDPHCEQQMEWYFRRVATLPNLEEDFQRVDTELVHNLLKSACHLRELSDQAREENAYSTIAPVYLSAMNAFRDDLLAVSQISGDAVNTEVPPTLASVEEFLRLSNTRGELEMSTNLVGVIAFEHLDNNGSYANRVCQGHRGPVTIQDTWTWCPVFVIRQYRNNEGVREERIFDPFGFEVQPWYPKPVEVLNN